MGTSGSCYPTSSGIITISPNNEAVYHINYGYSQGPLKLIYMTEDYQYGLSYFCALTSDTGACVMPAIDIIGKDTTLPDEIKSKMVPYATEMCIDEEDFAQFASEGPCMTPKSNPCAIDNIAAAQNVNWDEVVGTWYTIARLNGATKLRSATWDAQKTEDGKYSVTFVHAVDGQCTKAARANIIPDTNGSGNLVLSYGKLQSHGKIIKMTDNIMVYYECQHINSDGGCPKESTFLEFLSPTYDAIKISEYDNLIRKVCLDPADIESVPHDVQCKDKERCQVNNIATQDNFDPEQFVGNWHTIAGLSTTEGMDHADLEIQRDADGGLIVWYTGSKDGECVATNKIALKATDAVGQYDVVYGRHKGALKVAGTDYNSWAVLYECEQTTEDGTCEEGHEHIQILGRIGYEPRREDKETLDSILKGMCYSKTDFKRMTRIVSCPMVKYDTSCRIDNMPIAESFNLEKHLGVWYRLYTNLPGSSDSAKSLIQKVDGTMLISAVGSVDDVCYPPKIAVAQLRNDNTPDWKITSGRRSTRARLIHVDSSQTEAVVYYCTVVQHDGSCAPGKDYLTVSTRNPDATNRGRQLIEAYAPLACIDPSTMVPVSHPVDCHNIVLEVNDCLVSSLPTMTGFDIKKSLGDWYVVARLSGASSMDNEVVRFSLKDDGAVHVLISGSRNGKCQDTQEAILATAKEDQKTGTIRVLYNDYETALIYSCSAMTSKGKCFESAITVDLLRRTTDTIDERFKQQLYDVRVKEVCVDSTRMEDVQHSITCPIEEPSTPSCRISDIPSQENIDPIKLRGTWYKIAHLKTSVSMNSVAVHVASIGDDKVRAVYTAASRRGKCLSPASVVLNYPAGDTSTAKAVDTNGLFRIVSTDNQHALVYQCNNLNEDGTCPIEQLYVDVFSRTRDELPADVHENYTEIIHQLCFEQADFVKVSHDIECEIPYEDRMCIQDIIPVSKSFSTRQLSGIWYGQYRLKDSYKVDSIRYKFTKHDRHFEVDYSASRFHHRCVTSKANLTSDRPVFGTIDYGGFQGIIRVLYSSPSTLVLYECHRVFWLGDRTCNPEDTHLEILTRQVNQYNEEDRTNVLDVLRKACFQKGDLVKVDHSYPCPFENCKDAMKTISSIPKADMSNTDLSLLITQRWYGLAYLGNPSGWSSVSLKYTAIDDRNYLVHFVAARNGECREPVHLLYNMDPSGGGALYDVLATPWRGKYVQLYADDDVRMFWECLSVEDDDRCREGYSYIFVFGLSKEALTEEQIQKLMPVVSEMCYTKDQFSPLTNEVECDIPPRPTLSCSVDTLPSVQIDIDQFTGNWYSVARLRGTGYINSLNMRVKKVDETHIEVTAVATRLGLCLPAMTGIVAIGEDKVLQSEKGLGIRILWTDYSYFIAYGCTHLLDAGHCIEDGASITLFARTTTLDTNVMGKLKVLPGTECLDNHDFELVHQVVECTAKSDSCNLGKVPVQEDVDISKYAGLWYNGFRVRTADESAPVANQVYFDVEEDGSVTGYFAEQTPDGKCLETIKTSLLPDKEHTGLYWTPRGRSVKFVNTDGQYAIVYACFGDVVDGHCPAEKTGVFNLARETKHFQHAENFIQLDLARGLCFEPGDFEMVDFNHYCGLRKLRCSSDVLPQVENFDMERFTGTWYVMGRSAGINKYDSGVLRITTGENGAHKAFVKIAMQEDCSPTYTMEMSHEQGANIKVGKNDRIGSMKILATDYLYALVYRCEVTMSDGTCVPDKELFVLLSREEELYESDIRRMIQLADTECITEDDIEFTSRDVKCTLDLPENPDILIDDLPHYDGENVGFLGKWYTLFRQRNADRLDSENIVNRLLDNGDIKTYSTGSRNGKCTGSQITTLTPLGDQGNYSMTAESQFGQLYVRIMYMDAYYAVLYLCKDYTDQSSCFPDNVYISILGSDNTLPVKDDMQTLASVVVNAGIQIGDLVATIHDDDCGVSDTPRISCDFGDIPGNKDFSLRKFTGNWYAVAILKGQSLDGHTGRIILNENETVTLYNAMKEPRTGCSKTVVSLLTPVRGEPGLVMHTWGDTKEYSKVVLQDENYEWIMWYICTHVKDSGSCEDGAGTVVIYARRTIVPDDFQAFIKKIRPSFEGLCLSVDDIGATDQSETCPLNPSEIQKKCKVENIPVQRDFDISKFTGKWFTHFATRRDVNIESAIIAIDKEGEEDMRVGYAVKTRNGNCNRFSSVATATDKPGHFNSRMSKYRTLPWKVVKTNYEYALTYSCIEERPDGICEFDKTIVRVLSRSPDRVSDSVREKLIEYAGQMCIEPGDVVEFGVDIDCEPAETNVDEHCSIDHLPVAKHFHIDELTGTWYAVAKVDGNTVAPSHTVRITQGRDGQLVVLSTAYNFINKKCVDINKATLVQMDNPADFEVFFRGVKGRMRVIYMDGSYAMISECESVKDDGHCKPGFESIIVYSRTRDLPADAIERMITVADNSCPSAFTSADFVRVSQEIHCEPEGKHATQCKVRNMETVAFFQPEKFLGLWYSRYVLTHAPFDSLNVRYDRLPNGEIKAYYSASLNGKCKPIKTTAILEKEFNTGIWKISDGQYQEQVRILDTDYTRYAVGYVCGKVMDCGTCDPAYTRTFFATRDLDPIPETDLEKMKRLFSKYCFEAGDFKETIPNVDCNLYGGECEFSALKPQENFNMEKFTGTWYPLVRIRDKGLLDSAVVRIIHDSDESYKALITGTKKTDGECVSTAQIGIENNLHGNPADAKIIYKDKKDVQYAAYWRILYTDYEFAIVYICRDLDNNRCAPGHEFVYAISRQHGVTIRYLDAAITVANQPCFTTHDFEWIPQVNLCPLTEKKPDGCLVENIPALDTINIPDIVGTWYSQYNLRGKSCVDDTIVEFQDLGDGLVQAYISGSRNGECLGTLSTIVNINQEGGGLVEVSGSLRTSSTYVKLLHLEEDFAVVYQCTKALEDGHCADDSVYVNIVSRSKDHTFTDDDKSKLIQLARGTCFEPGDFAQTKHEIECAIKKSSVSNCPLVNLRSQLEPSVEKVTGTWYALYRLNGPLVFDSQQTRIVKTNTGITIQGTGTKRNCKCFTLVDVSMAQSADNPADFTADHNGRKGRVRIMATYQGYIVMYGCRDELEDELCSQGHAGVTIYGRTTQLPDDETKNKLVTLASGSCYTDEDFEPVPHHVDCPIERYSSNDCKVTHIPAMADFDPHKFSGVWYGRYRIRGSSPLQSTSMRFDDLFGGKLRARFSGILEDKCNNEEFVLTPTENTGDFNMTVGVEAGVTRIVDTDYDTFAIIYECYSILDSGFCADGQAYVTIMSRGRDTRFHPELIAKVKQGMHQRCFETGDFEEVAQENECKVDERPHQHQHVSSSLCKVADIEGRTDLTINQLSGRWYAVGILQGSYKPASYTIYIKHIKDGLIQTYVAAARPRGGCTKPAVYTTNLEKHFIDDQRKIIWCDDKYLVRYECESVGEDGFCIQGSESVILYARIWDPVPDSVKRDIQDNLDDKCFETDHYEPIKNTVSCDVSERTTCKVKSIPFVKHFDVNKFSGRWYSTHLLYGGSSWDSATFELEQIDDSTVKAYFAGKVNNVCLPTISFEADVPVNGVAIWKPKGQPTAVMKVVGTDYEYALLYVCLNVLDDDTCEDGTMFVDVLSRRQSPLPVNVIEKLKTLTTMVCVQPGDFKGAVSQGEPCDPVTGLSDTCKFENIPTQIDFDSDRYLGQWYVGYQLKRPVSDQTPLPNVAYFEKLVDGSIRGYIMRRVDGVCSEKKSFRRIPDADDPASFTDDGYSHVKIVRTNYHYALVYICVVGDGHGFCPTDKTHIAIVTRDRQPIPISVVNEMKRVVSSNLCYQPNDLVQVEYESYCDLKKVSCDIGQLPQAKNFKMDKFTGTWYIMGRSRKVDRFDSGKMRILYANDGTYTAYVTASQDGKCNDTYQVRMKASGGGDIATSINKRSGLVRVIAKDAYYDHALIYLCGSLTSDGSCSPDKEIILALSRKEQFSESVAKNMIQGSGVTCLSIDDLEYTSRSVKCNLDTPQPSDILLSDLPRQTDGNSEKFVGTWYGLYRLRDTRPIESLTAKYTLLENGALSTHVMVSKNGDCGGTLSGILHQTETKSIWRMDNGMRKSYIRVLYADDSHAIIYECNHITEEDPKRCVKGHSVIEVIGKTREEPTGTYMAVLRKTVRLAGYEPGDMGHLKRNVDCDPNERPKLDCDLHNAPDVPWDVMKGSGTWYALARVKGTFVADSAKVRVQVNPDESLKVFFGGYSRRFGCFSTVGVDEKLMKDKQSTFEITYPDFPDQKGLVKLVYVTKDYSYVLAYFCLLLNEDGTCTPGYEMGALYGRRPYLPPNLIATMNKVLSRFCVDANHFEKVNYEEQCDIDYDDIPEKCTLANIRTQTSIDHDRMSGLWHSKYLLRNSRKHTWIAGKVYFSKMRNGYVKESLAVTSRDGTCFQQHAITTFDDEPNGIRHNRFGKYLTLDFRIIRTNYAYAMVHACDKVRDDGLCNIEDTVIGIWSRSTDPIPQNILDVFKQHGVAMCMQPGDFREMTHDDDCQIVEPLLEDKCPFDQLPMMPNFDVDQMTGTWYAVAKIKGNFVMPSMAIKISHVGPGEYSRVVTAYDPERKRCVSLPSAKLFRTSDTAHFDLEELNYHGHLRVIYSDGMFAMIAECMSVQEDGHCDPGLETVIVYSRGRNIPADGIQRMFPSVYKACPTLYSASDFVSVDGPEPCEVGTHRKPECRVRNIPAQANFNTDEFVGKWYSRYVLKGSAHYDAETVEIKKIKDDTIRIFHMEVRDYECLPVKSEDIRLADNNGAAIWTSTNKDGTEAQTRVVYTDYARDAVIHRCEKIQSDGSCDPQDTKVLVVSRDTEPIAEDELKRLIGITKQTCFELGDFFESYQYLECDLSNECQYSKLPSQPDFNMLKFTGTWHMLARIKNLRYMDTLSIRYTLGEDGKYLAYVAGVPCQTGTCTKSGAVNLEPGYDGDAANIKTVYKPRNATGHSRVIWTDYDLAIEYVCTQTTGAGTCAPGKDTINIMSRRTTTTVEELAETITKAKLPCFTRDDFELIPRSVSCELDVPKECKIKDIPPIAHFDVDEFMGTWYSKYRLRSSLEVESVVVEFEKLENGNIKIYATGTRDGICSNTIASLARPADDNIAQMDIRIGQGRSESRVLYKDTHRAVVFECRRYLDDGSCDPKEAYIDVIYRDKNLELSEKDRERTKDLFKGSCIQPGDFVETQQRVTCPVNKGSKNVCFGSYIPTEESFNLDKFSGTWYAIYRMKSSTVPDSATFRLTVEPDGKILFRFTGSRRGECLPTSTLQLTANSENTAVLEASKDGQRGSLRIVATDYNYGILYQCTAELEDGTCSKGYQLIAGISRTTQVPPKSVVGQMLQEVKQFCLLADDFERVQHIDECHVPIYHDGRCQVTNIPPEENFDINKFSGVWNMKYVLRKSGTSYESASVHFQPLPNNRVRGHYHFFVNDECRDLDVMFTGKDIPGDYTISSGSYSGVIRVVATDYDTYAVVYECDSVDQSGFCVRDKEYIGILSRSREDFDDLTLAELRNLVRKGCFQPGDFMELDQTSGCEIDVNTVNQPRASGLRCRISELEPQPHLDLSKMTGSWYGVARLRGSYSLDSLSAFISQVDENSISLVSSGAHKRGGCHKTAIKTLSQVSGTPSKLIADEGCHKSLILVLYTDYEYAIVYECFHIQSDGVCSEGSEAIVVLSRSTKPLSTAAITRMAPVVTKACFSPDDFEAIFHDVDCTVSRSSQCTVSSIPFVYDFKVEQFLGTWHTVYLLRGTSQWDSALYNFEITENGAIHAEYTGSVRGECQTTLEEEYEMPVDGKGMWRTTRDGKNAMVKVVGTNYKYAVVYTCDEILPDDTCARDKMYVDIIARQPGQVPVAMIEKLKFVVTKACVEPGDFITVQDIVSCDPDATVETPTEISRKCPYDSLPVQTGFIPYKFSGVWLSVGKYKGTTSLDSAMFIANHVKGGQLQTMFRGERDGKCLPVMSPVFIPTGDSSVADFRVDSGYLRVLYTDYNYAFMAGCFKMDPDGACANGSGTAIAYSRTGTISEAARQKLIEVAQEACLSENDFQLTQRYPECDLPFNGRKSCRVEHIGVQEDFTLSGLYGRWELLMMTTKLGEIPDPATVIFNPVDGGKVRFSVARKTRDGNCIDFVAYMDYSGQSEFTYMYDGKPSTIRVIFKNSQYLMIYECSGAELVEGMCPRDHEFIQIWGRVRASDLATTTQLRNFAIERSCVNLDNLEPADENDECEVPKICQFTDIITEENYDTRVILGSWHLLGRSTTMAESSLTESNLVLAYAGEKAIKFSVAGKSDGDACEYFSGTDYPSEDQRGMFTYDLGSTQGSIKYVYVDTKFMITFECSGSMEDGECPGDKRVLQVWGRDYGELSAPDRIKLTQIIEENLYGCIEQSALILSDQSECEPTDITGLKSCKVDDMELQNGFDIDKLEGTWFQIGRTSAIPTNTWDGGVVNFRITYERDIEITFTGLKSSTSTECLPVTHQFIYPDDENPADVLYNSQRLGVDDTVGKFMYLDDDHFILYECIGDRRTEFGVCDKDSENVKIFSRRRYVNTLEKQRLRDLLASKTCMLEDSFVLANHTTRCHIAGVTDHVHSYNCKAEKYPVQENFDYQQFLGLWYEVERTRYTRHNIWESGLMNFEWNDVHKALLFRYTGTRNGKCQKPFIAGAQTKRNGLGAADMTFMPGMAYGNPWTLLFHYKIIYTDYNTAVIYTCFSEDDYGNCRQHGSQTTILAREPHIDETRLHMLHSVISDKLCVDVHDLVKPAFEAHCHVLIGEQPPAPTCSPIMCLKFCQNGFKQDENGCDICECYWPEPSTTPEPPTPTCSPVMCLMFCENGFKKDENGCDICECSTCSNVECRMHCEHGFKKDNNGCEICECADPAPTCSPVMCLMFCENGFKKDENGCDICECSTCSIVECLMHCEHGFIKDKNGCEICECAYPLPTCSPVMCLMFCENGFKQDKNGCDICECAEPATECGLIECRMHCEHGFKKDVNGCDLCECAEQLPTFTCSLKECRKYCTHGFKKDKNGCDTCECNEPMENTTPEPENPIADSELGPEGSGETDTSGSGPEAIVVPGPEAIIVAPKCPIPMCFNPCLTGYKIDDDGCMDCECNEAEGSGEAETADEPKPASNEEEDTKESDEVEPVPSDNEEHNGEDETDVSVEESKAVAYNEEEGFVAEAESFLDSIAKAFLG